MTLLTIIIALWITSAVIRSVKETKRKRAEAQRCAELARMTAEFKAQKAQAELEAKRMAEIEREQTRQAKEQEKLAKEADLEYRVSQAESAIYNEQIKLDHYTAKLSALDEELAKIDRDIEYYKLANQVDAENRARAARDKVEDKIFSFEEKVRTCEMRMDKAQRTKAMAQREMEVA